MKQLNQNTFHNWSGQRRVLALALMLFGLAAPYGSAQTVADLFDDQHVHDIWLDVNPADWKTLRDNYLADTYYPATFNWNGRILHNIGIRSRGSGSRSPEKPNLLLGFSRYDSKQQLLGLPSVILKANNQDASLMREIVAMNLFRRMGIPAVLEAPARLFINGEFFGAYMLNEVLDEAFLRRNFGEDTGYLYDWEENRTDGYRFEYLGPDPALYSPAMWSPKTRKTDPDPANIEAMVRAVNFAPDADFEREVSKYVDLKQFMTYIATENFLADFDGVLGGPFGMNNFYFYRFAGTTVGQFLPWDKDGTFSWEGKSIFDGVEENVLARRAMQVPELRKTYLDALAKAAALAGGPGGWMDGEINRLYYQIRGMARLDPNKQCSTAGVIHPCGAEDFEREVEIIRLFTRERAGFVTAEAIAAGHLPSTLGPGIE
ncbi:MAG: CotH kinase family protein [Bryobacterales bacterium]|nr:CotH kinase family protein [Bryobacterales bacterium]